VLAHHADDVDARTIAVGRSPHGPVAQFTEGSFTIALTRAASATVVFVRPDEAPHELTADTMAELRSQ
jgi:MFS transporter, ACDE family, multidrug resistance protein